MTFANNTRFAAIDLPLIGADGRDVVVAVVKATFDIASDGRLRLADVQRPVRINDELYFPDAPEGSVRMPTDVCVAKGGADLVVVGSAVSRRPVEVMDVGVQAADRTIPLRVHGPRVYYQGLGGVVIGPAAPFESQPIIYEKAYGGVADEGWTVEPRNRAGVGVGKHKRDLVDKPAPQIEHPARPHKRASDDHAPVGFGAIRSHWSPRLERSGTFDEVWEKTRMPMPPLDFDVRSNNVAHPGLLFDKGLAVGERIGIAGMTLDDPIVFELPAVDVVIRARSDESGWREVRPQPDTILVEVPARQLELTLRAAFPIGRGKDVLRELAVEAG